MKKEGVWKIPPLCKLRDGDVIIVALQRLPALCNVISNGAIFIPQKVERHIVWWKPSTWFQWYVVLRYKSTVPANVECWKCEAELAYSEEDIRLNNGYPYVKCPICSGYISVDAPNKTGGLNENT